MQKLLCDNLCHRGCSKTNMTGASEKVKTVTLPKYMSSPPVFKGFVLLIFIPSPTKLQRNIVTLPSVRPFFRPSFPPSVESL